MKIRMTLSAILLALLIISSNAIPQRLINYQGKLVNGGMPITDKVTVLFSMYKDSTGGIALWKESQDIEPQNGIFNVLLGSSETLRDTLFANHSELYLGIKVGTDAEMKPRFLMASVPYSISAFSPKIQAGREHFGEIPDTPDNTDCLERIVSLTGFSSPPTVLVSLAAIDSKYDVNLRIVSEAKEITVSSFKLRVCKWADTHIYQASVTWIAFGY